MTSTRRFPLKEAWIRASPFRDRKTVRQIEAKWKNGQSIGFTAMASLKSMGRIPRSNGKYQIGAKYLNL